MQSFAVAPSPNWNSPEVISVRESDRIYASACFKTAVIYQLEEKKGEFNLKLLKSIFHNHLRVGALAIYPNASDKDFGNTIAMAGDNGGLWVTDMTTEEKLFQLQHKKLSVGTCLNSLSWCIVDKEASIAAVVDSLLIVWCPKYSAANFYTLAEPNMTLIKTVPNKLDEALVVSGNHILHVQLKGGHIIRQFKGHTSPIYFFTFKNAGLPFSSSGDNDDVNTNPLCFATSDYNCDVITWDFSSPTYLSKRKIEFNYFRKPAFTKDQKFHVCLSWEEGQLLATTPNGQIVVLESDFKKSKVLVHAHHKVIYNMVSIGKILISCGQDRQIIGTCRDSGKIVFVMTTQGVNCCSMAFSPQDATRLALGTQDGCLDLLTYKDGHFERSSMDRQRGKIKIFSLSWHPTNETKILYGTSEGQVGICNVMTHQTNFFAHHHLKSTYTVHWAPLPASLRAENTSEDDLYQPYSFGDQEIFIRNVAALNERKPASLLKIAEITEQRSHYVPTDFSFSSNYELISIGCKNGSILILELETLKMKFLISVIHKTIQHLLWKPFSQDSSGLTLAVGSGGSSIYIFNLPETENQDCVTITKASKELSGHSLRVVWLAWSPHDHNILASASYDSYIQLWNTEKGEPICCYGGHAQRAFRVEFAPYDPDLMVSFSEENAIHQWRPSEVETQTPKDFKPRSSKTKTRSKRSEPNTSINSSTSETKENGEPAVKPPSVRTHFPLFHALESNKKKFHQLCILAFLEATDFSEESDDEADIDQIEGGSDNERSLKEHFENAVKKYGELFEDSSVHKAQDGSTFLKHFGSFEHADEALLSECAANEENDQHENSMEIHCWRGSLRERIKWAITNKRLNPYIISLSPQVSFSIWEESCEAYANQLMESQDFVRAATYFVSIGKNEKAVDILLSSRHFKEAYSIARCRLSFEPRVLKKVVTTWADRAIMEGNFELATLLYLSIKDREMAAKTMSRRHEYLSLALGGELYKSLGNFEMAESVLVNSLRIASLRHHWEAVDHIISLNENLKWFSFVNVVHMRMADTRIEYSPSGFALAIQRQKKFVTMMREHILDPWMDLGFTEKSQDVINAYKRFDLLRHPNTVAELNFYVAVVWTHLELGDEDTEFLNNLVRNACRTILQFKSPKDVFIAMHFIWNWNILEKLDCYKDFQGAFYYSEWNYLFSMEDLSFIISDDVTALEKIEAFKNYYESLSQMCHQFSSMSIETYNTMKERLDSLIKNCEKYYLRDTKTD